ncbi:hypothetical protein F511_27487 [Dorcoceras hygrometricum]|uniref:Reverse transcriptase zinc-binding domain-containing protein n=1 Tax=Dorcoceras hygrometricum TaxID=472368 RepID=A0A2Z7CXE8_9LAMI|nr:hypothetical protein F511_27487 [Dorcoceras hygrometricum]
MAVEADVWKSYIVPKHQFSLSIFAHGKLLAWDRIPFVPDKKCVLRKQVDEDLEHLFFMCSYTSRICKRVKGWLDITDALNSRRVSCRVPGEDRKEQGKAQSCHTGSDDLLCLEHQEQGLL